MFLDSFPAAVVAARAVCRAAGANDPRLDPGSVDDNQAGAAVSEVEARLQRVRARVTEMAKIVRTVALATRSTSGTIRTRVYERYRDREHHLNVRNAASSLQDAIVTAVYALLANGPAGRRRVLRSTFYDVARDLYALGRTYPGAYVERLTGTVCVTSPPVRYDSAVFDKSGPKRVIDLGAFLVQFRPVAAPAGGYDLLATALTPCPPLSQGYATITHPHVRDEKFCLGEAERPLTDAAADLRVWDAVARAMLVLEGYNPGSPYFALKNWDSKKCRTCGSMHPPASTVAPLPCPLCHAANPNAAESCGYCMPATCAEPGCGATRLCSAHSRRCLRCGKAWCRHHPSLTTDAFGYVYCRECKPELFAPPAPAAQPDQTAPTLTAEVTASV